MATTYKLTYFKPRRCWKKRHDKKTYYVGSAGVRKGDRAAYEAALAEWQAVEAHLEERGPDPYEDDGRFDPEKYRKRLAVFILSQPGLSLADRAQRIQIAAATATAGEEQQPVNEPAVVPDLSTAVFMATDYTTFQPTLTKSAPPDGGDYPLDDLVAKYLKARAALSAAGELSAKQYAQSRDKLADFQAFARVAGKRLMSELDADLLGDYQTDQRKQAARPEDSKGYRSPFTIKKRLAEVVAFFRWAYRNEKIDRVPRVLDKDYASVNLPRPDPKFFTVEEIRTLFDAADRRTKTYVALAVNLAYTQREISTLTWEMIDGAGIVNRLRPKTEQPQPGKLWPVTLRLLREESHATKGVCLLSRNGRPLLEEGIKADGSIFAFDSIKSRFSRLLKKCGLENTGRTFKHLRKSAADEIAKKYEDHQITDQFLAHSSAAMRKHYTLEHTSKLFTAISYLDGLYHLADLMP